MRFLTAIKPTRVDLYVLQTVMRPMRNIFIFVIVILECVRFRVGLSLAAGQENFFALMLTYMGQWLALYSGLALQMALAIGVMLGFTRLAQNRELDALHALGFSLHRLLAPVMGLAIIAAVADFAILGWAQPISLYNSGNFVHQAQRFVSLLPEGGDFFLVSADKTVLIDGIAPKSNKFQKILVLQELPDGTTTTTAGSSGFLHIVADDPKQYYNVEQVTLLQTKASQDQAKRAPLDSFTVSASANLKGPIQVIDTSAYRKRGYSEWEMTLPELAFYGSPVGAAVDPIAMKAELHYRLAQVLYILLLPLIAILAVVEPRRNPGPFRFLMGLLAILSFHQFLGIMASTARNGAQLSPWFVLWLPLFLLAIVIIACFRWLSIKPGFSTAR